ncbi:MAG: biotin synthase BioB [Candidatus Binatia bacterium]|nr:biotin synthase BioB [Candidatus Binatia bacterium]
MLVLDPPPLIDSPFATIANKILTGGEIDRAEARAVLLAPVEALPALLWSAFKVRERFFGRRVKLCQLRNARSGLCPEDCHYCSQSAISTAPIPRYRLDSVAQLLEGARRAVAAGATRYCMVTSGRGPSPTDIERFCAAARAIKSEFPQLELCVSPGLLDADQAYALKEAGIDYVNHNLNTSRRFYPEICTTHTFDDRVATVRAVQAAGLRTCCGGIVGLGETEEDLIDLALDLRALRVDSLPVNFLHPIEGTPLEGRKDLDPAKCLRALCLMRFVRPDAEIRVAGGRELHLGSWQALALFPANSLFVDGYLTTPGDAADQVRALVTSLGFEVEA